MLTFPAALFIITMRFFFGRKKGHMFCSIKSAALDGIRAKIINVEVDVNDGLPVFEMVGLPSSEVREAKERVRVALRNAGFFLPPKHITANLSPADIRKEGTAFDLPIAVAVLGAAGLLDTLSKDSILFIGELSLDGRINAVSGVLPVVYEALRSGFKYCMVPYQNRKEASAIEGIGILAVGSIFDAISAIKDPEPFIYSPEPKNPSEKEYESPENDLCDLIGQNVARRALEVAAAGHHNLLMTGAPGAGKTMIARCIPGILPKLTVTESLELSMIYSVAGLLKNDSAIVTKRPFRSPHHTISAYALTGGGAVPKPGEISLASKGVLFLDELPEFNRGTIEILRQPLESREISINRVNGSAVFPADFMLVAAMNPCKCGFYPDRSKCTCTQMQVRNYMGKISQPLLDRFDIRINVGVVGVSEWFDRKKGETSESVRERVTRARQIQEERFKDSKFKTNSCMNSVQTEEICRLGEKELALMKEVFVKYELSGRGYHRILRVARTIADLAGAEDIGTEHLAEAVSYRGVEV
jgi:magnesium chelatase family protein